MRIHADQDADTQHWLRGSFKVKRRIKHLSQDSNGAICYNSDKKTEKFKKIKILCALLEHVFVYSGIFSI
jgi:hypothetical protein